MSDHLSVAIVCYVILAAEFLVRYIDDRPVGKSKDAFESRVPTTSHMKLMLIGMSLMTVFIFIRYVARLS